VRHPDPGATELDDELLRERLAERRLVGIAVDGVHRHAERVELVQDRGRDEIARVQDRVGRRQPAQALLRQPARPARQVRVGDDGDAGQPTSRKRPSR
jgi:hypothetical protein